MTAEHRKPFLAYLAVALLCAVIVGLTARSSGSSTVTVAGSDPAVLSPSEAATAAAGTSAIAGSAVVAESTSWSSRLFTGLTVGDAAAGAPSAPPPTATSWLPDAGSVSAGTRTGTDTGTGTGTGTGTATVTGDDTTPASAQGVSASSKPATTAPTPSSGASPGTVAEEPAASSTPSDPPTMAADQPTAPPTVPVLSYPVDGSQDGPGDVDESAPRPVTAAPQADGSGPSELSPPEG